MGQFVADHRATYGVEPIGQAMGMAPSTFYEPQARTPAPARAPARAQREAVLRPEIARCGQAHQRVYGAKKGWKQWNREGIRVARCTVARCTVARLLKAAGLRGGVRGGVRGRRVRTTIPEPALERPRDLVHRPLRAERPNPLGVADCTYVAPWRGFVYVAFVLDVFSRRIVGWRVSPSRRTDLALDALDALEQALYDRETDGPLIHHRDRGRQYLSITYSERLAVAGIEPSVGRRGDRYDNALAETIIGLVKTEVLHHRGPWKGMEDVEFATLGWVSWSNTERIREPLGDLSPAEYEAQYLRTQSSDLVEVGLN